MITILSKLGPVKALRFIAPLAIMLTVIWNSAGYAKDDSTTLRVIQDSKAAYAALSNYSDTGKVIIDTHGRLRTNIFNVHLARSNYYRIEWEEMLTIGHHTMTNKGATWSSGSGDFLLVGKGIQTMTNRDLALSAASAISSLASTTIPGIFFNIGKMSDLTVLASKGSQLSQEKDEQVGEVDCDVVIGWREQTWQRIKMTLWIGKHDHLIHQSRSVFEDVDITLIPDNMGRENKAALQREPRRNQGNPTIFTEIHENISTNNVFKSSDFVHEAPVVE